ncbi:Cytochrome b6-f complex iron-sulfur subunit [Dyadobacter sp. CECT 9623]|uniref:Cytochrome b6-f complex iron-sulfur subunit n=1 Tax=Dyadobacter linearis TaxID=2823330 RepID=A0ABM8UJB3_9BACT|nr:FAD-dependent oxidoreductase [Dyadobacter sp. CECT 9623]CAG5067597.1 Cytochrome b6-f complex iron-sulfur subunit [Dyadobacter sp. CECT 9623]
MENNSSLFDGNGISNKPFHRDGFQESLWQKSADTPGEYGEFDPSTLYDTLIVGAGITGLTTALLLQEGGKKCVIVDAHSPGFGTTGGTSAHINTFADTTYDEVEKDFGKEAAVQFAESIARSVAMIDRLVQKYNIECDFEWKNGYVYSETDQETEELNTLFESALSAGVSAKIAEHAPAPVPYKKAVVFDRQAQFHPLKYISALQKHFVEKGGVVINNTLIEGVDSEDGHHVAKSADKQIKAKTVVYATHIPPGGVNVLHFRNAPYRSYVIAATLADGAYPDALIYDMQEPYHYFRTHTTDGQQYLVVGGHDHKTAHGDPEQSFADLIEYTKQCYQVEEVVARWSAQYYVPSDGLPYIGQLPGASSGIYTATGFNGNGMILGTVSAMVISDLILHGQSVDEDLYSPGRIKPIAGFTEFVKENADVAARFIGDRFGIEEIKSISEIPADSGQIVEFDDQKLAIYKDQNGRVSALNPVCTHTHCIVNWNNAEKSWDCPCHGARFDTDGVVLTGPARENLEKVNINMQNQ